MMESDLLKRLLEAEQQAKMLVQEAQNRADLKVRETSAALQARLQQERDSRLKELDREFAAFTKDLEEKRDRELHEYEASLQKEPAFPEDAFRAIREILWKP